MLWYEITVRERKMAGYDERTKEDSTVPSAIM